MRAALEGYANRLWYQHRRPPWLLRALARVHETLWRHRWKRPGEQPPVPVVVVGNLSVGGGGKTPVVITLARELAAAGRRPAILCRGYRRQSSVPVQQVASDADPAQVGDESVLLAQATGLPVWVGRQRQLALEAAIQAGAEVVISDDGLQHRHLPRSLEIVVIDGQRGFGNGWLLPAGPLRQPVDRLQSADIVLRRGKARDAGLPGQSIEMTPQALVRLADGQRFSLVHFGRREVDVVCGIANPDQFAATLRALGLKPRLRAFPDHHPYTAADLAGLAGPILTTAKDAVKLARLAPELSLDEIFVLEISAQLPPDVTRRVIDHVQQFRS